MIATGRRIRNATWMWLKVPIKIWPMFESSIPKDSRYTELKQRGKVHRRSKENWLLKKEKNSYTSFTLEMANTKERSEEMSLGVQLCDWKVFIIFFPLSFVLSFIHFCSSLINSRATTVPLIRTLKLITRVLTVGRGWLPQRHWVIGSRTIGI